MLRGDRPESPSALWVNYCWKKNVLLNEKRQIQVLWSCYGAIGKYVVYSSDEVTTGFSEGDIDTMFSWDWEIFKNILCKLPLKIYLSTLSEEIAHPTVYHHLSQLSVNIQLNGLIKFREDSGVQMQLTKLIFHSLSWISNP